MARGCQINYHVTQRQIEYKMTYVVLSHMLNQALTSGTVKASNLLMVFLRSPISYLPMTPSYLPWRMNITSTKSFQSLTGILVLRGRDWTLLNLVSYLAASSCKPLKLGLPPSFIYRFGTLWESILGSTKVGGGQKSMTLLRSRTESWTNLRCEKKSCWTKLKKKPLSELLSRLFPLMPWLFSNSQSFCRKLCAIVAKFWWASNGGVWGMHWKKWRALTSRKAIGSIGFRSFEELNQTHIAKQAWRILNNPHVGPCFLHLPSFLPSPPYPTIIFKIPQLTLFQFYFTHNLNFQTPSGSPEKGLLGLLERAFQ